VASQTLDMISPLSLLRFANRLLGPVAPGTSARLARRVFTRPHRHRPPEREYAAERSGQRVELGDGVSALRWGRGPRILAMHGWEGRATQWGLLAELATTAGFEVIAIDAPAHGLSTGRDTNIAEFVRVLLDADRRHGPFAAVIGHSMGGASAALALASGLRAERAVLISAPSSIERVLRGFASHVQLAPRAEQAFFAELERTVGHAAEDLDVAGLALRHPALLLHSRDDREVPFTEAEAIDWGWPHAELLALDGLGHRRILREGAVIGAAVEFITESARLAHAS
jgi:pimeloyl-ACP methyl ester carboxylesterase